MSAADPHILSPNATVDSVAKEALWTEINLLPLNVGLQVSNLCEQSYLEPMWSARFLKFNLVIRQ